MITLNNNETANLNVAGGAAADIGSWTDDFVLARIPEGATAAPSAVTGTFDVNILEAVSIVGAFGAERR